MSNDLAGQNKIHAGSYIRQMYLWPGSPFIIQDQLSADSPDELGHTSYYQVAPPTKCIKRIMPDKKFIIKTLSLDSPFIMNFSIDGIMQSHYH